MYANYSGCVKGWRVSPVTHRSSSQPVSTIHFQKSGWLAGWQSVLTRHINSQTPDWSCVSGLLCCCQSHRCHFWNFVLSHLWNPPGLVLLLFFPLLFLPLFQNHYWTVSPPAPGALWRRSAASGDNPSNYPAGEPINESYVISKHYKIIMLVLFFYVIVQLYLL